MSISFSFITCCLQELKKQQLGDCKHHAYSWVFDTKRSSKVHNFFGSMFENFFTGLDTCIYSTRPMATQLIQYVVVRADLIKALNWPVGSIIAQACHACCAVIHLFRDDPYTQEYLKDLDNMHKVVLEVPDEPGLRKLEDKLKENDILHKMWIEQPENFPTCIVVKPYPKEVVQKYFKKLKLFKG